MNSKLNPRMISTHLNSAWLYCQTAIWCNHSRRTVSNVHQHTLPNGDGSNPAQICRITSRAKATVRIRHEYDDIIAAKVSNHVLVWWQKSRPRSHIRQQRKECCNGGMCVFISESQFPVTRGEGQAGEGESRGESKIYYCKIRANPALKIYVRFSGYLTSQNHS